MDDEAVSTEIAGIVASLELTENPLQRGIFSRKSRGLR